jgi:precorrin-8X/cobalt-precorrin-8 methylmutase
MPQVEKSDSVIWLSHIQNGTNLLPVLKNLQPAQQVTLTVSGQTRQWQKMDLGRDGRTTNGIKPSNLATKNAWAAIADGQVVDIDLATAQTPAVRPVSLIRENETITTTGVNTRLNRSLAPTSQGIPQTLGQDGKHVIPANEHRVPTHVESGEHVSVNEGAKSTTDQRTGRMFDLAVMVDWSSGEGRRTGKDSIWIGYGLAEDPDVTLLNPATRSAAYDEIVTLLKAAVEKGQRVLLGFDFAYGYPAGFADAIGLDTGGEPRWRAVWRHMHALANDTNIGGGDRNNGIDKFAVANDLNRQFNVAQHLQPPLLGPFWGRADWTLTRDVLDQLPPDVRNTSPFCKGSQKDGGEERRRICAGLGVGPPDYPYLSMCSPGYPVPFGARNLRKFRRTECGNRAQETWHIFGPGTVGGQSISGIPYLHDLLVEPSLARVSQVWPFTTGLSDPVDGKVGPLIVHAEIFPNTVPISRDVPPSVTIPDARQVWTLVDHARRLDAAGLLLEQFRPAWAARIDNATKERITDEEGWILFMDLLQEH